MNTYRKIQNVLILFLALFILAACSNDEKATEEPSASEPRDATENGVKLIVEDEIKSTTNSDKERVREVKINDIPDNKNVVIHLNGSDNLTDKMVKTGMWMDTVSILKPINELGEFDTISVLWYLPLVDTKRNTEDAKVLSFDFPKSELDQDVWDKFLYQNLPTIASDFYEHPVMQKIE